MSPVISRGIQAPYIPFYKRYKFLPVMMDSNLENGDNIQALSL